MPWVGPLSVKAAGVIRRFSFHLPPLGDISFFSVRGFLPPPIVFVKSFRVSVTLSKCTSCFTSCTCLCSIHLIESRDYIPKTRWTWFGVIDIFLKVAAPEAAWDSAMSL